MEKALIAAAQRQHGLLTRAQLRKAGVEPRAITYRLSITELVEVRPSV